MTSESVRSTSKASRLYENTDDKTAIIMAAVPSNVACDNIPRVSKPIIPQI
jgi:hypothetical protein